MRTFLQLDTDGRMLAKTKARSARRAGLKMTPRDDTLVHVLDVDLLKLHSYYRGTRELRNEEKTEWSSAHNIQFKPVASKAAYKSAVMLREVIPGDASDLTAQKWNTNQPLVACASSLFH